jgi:signal transduction histidine kinase
MHHRARSLALMAALVALDATMSLGQPTAESAPPPGSRQPTVLVLALEDFTRPWVRLIFEGFSTAVSGAPDSPAIYFEALDATRFQEQSYLQQLREWLTAKYRGKDIDLVVPLGEDALGFLVEAHGEPWPRAQVLYLEAGSVRYDTPRVLPQAGGMLIEDHSVEALRTIRTVLPQTKHVAMIHGASAIEAIRFRGFEEKIRQAGLDPIRLAARSLEDTVAAVAHLPPDTAVMMLAPIVDAKGRVFGPAQTCALISSASNAPTFTLGVHDLGCGVLGGLMRDWDIVGRRLGEEALARLKNRSTAVITLPVAKFTTLAFDERQLVRWGVSERGLPPGAAVHFREPNLWHDNRGLVVAALGVTAVQSLLIAGLIFEHRRRRKAEIEARRNLTAMAHLDRRAAMGELASSLAHELNQPLNAILQNAGVAQMLLAANNLPLALAEMPEIVSDIRKDDIRASEVIRRMRGLLQKHELESHPFDLNEVAVETLAIVRPDARSREVQLEIDLADDLQPILGDRIHLQQVLLNLLMNAIDAVTDTPAERRRVRVSTAIHNGEVRMAVADTGKGIHAEPIAEIFEPFYSTKGEDRGMGMGLAIARGIVEAHRGRIAAMNNPEGGATVWFTLPRA